MGCLYSMDTICSICDDNPVSLNPPGAEYIDDEWVCVCEIDENPADSCELYESNWVCPECGADLNIEDCDCEDD